VIDAQLKSTRRDSEVSKLIRRFEAVVADLGSIQSRQRDDSAKLPQIERRVESLADATAEARAFAQELQARVERARARSPRQGRAGRVRPLGARVGSAAWQAALFVRVEELRRALDERLADAQELRQSQYDMHDLPSARPP
jgi:hypothetical protein